ncbi:MAG: Regulatory sensor-transducer, BlaR1/MecR1 family [Chthonomonadales bacterium]|nr:Regulatory sensor-transducer, BlaR1/MecR1 family [Chthonomonadales bacterium]
MALWNESLNMFASAWLETLIRACWQGGLALGLVWAVCRLVPRIPAAGKCWLWRLAYLKLLVALLWLPTLDLPLLPPADPAPAAETMASVTSTTVSIRAADLSADAMPQAALSFATPTFAGWLLLAWIGSLLWQSGQIVRQGFAVRKLRRASQPLNGGQLDFWNLSLSRDLNLTHVPQLLSSTATDTPLLIGMIRPCIVLPESLLSTCTADELRLVLAHELAHVQRRDLLWGWLPLLARFVCGFHPLVLLAEREIGMAQEIACDETALHLTGAASAAYGSLLVRVAARFTPRFSRGFGMVGMTESYHTLKRRLSAMKSFPSAPRNYRVAVRFSLCTLGLAALAPWRVAAQTPMPAPASDSAPTVAAQVTVATAPKTAPVKAQDTTTTTVHVSQDRSVTITGGSDQHAWTSTLPVTASTRSATIISSPTQNARTGAVNTISGTRRKVTTRSLSGETQTTPSATPGYPFAAPGMIATTPSAVPSQRSVDVSSRNVTVNGQASRNADGRATATVITNGRQATISRIQSSRAGDAVIIDGSTARVSRVATGRAGDAVSVNTSPATVNRISTSRGGDAVIIDGTTARVSRVATGRAGDAVRVDTSPTVSGISTSRAGRAIVVDGSSGTVSRITSDRAGGAVTIDASPARASDNRVIVVPRDSSAVAGSAATRVGRRGGDTAPIAAAAQTATYHIEMRLVRYQVDAQGKVTETVVTTPSVLQKDNSGATVTMMQGEGGYTLLVTPRHDTDSTVMLSLEVRELGEQGEVVHSGKNVRSIKLGEAVHITGMTDATDKALRRAVMRGEIVTDHGAYTGYYVEVKTTLIKPASAVKP